MDKELEYKIRDNFSEALEHFDFSTVQNVMTYLDWRWCGESHPPSQIRMIITVKELFEYGIKSFKGSTIYTSTGGFTVTIYELGKVKIYFAVEESYSYD